MHKDIRARRMVYLTQFSIPDLLNPRKRPPYCFWYVRMSFASKWPDWSMALCLVVLCLSLCRPLFHWSKLRLQSPSSDAARLAASWRKKLAPLAKKLVRSTRSKSNQSYDIRISTSTKRTDLSFFPLLMLIVMSTQFSLACICACACAYAYAYAHSVFA